MIKKINPNQKGFTITELSIAMSMLSVLLIIILLSILNIISIYNKGVTLKRVNQSGRAITAEVQADLRKSVSTGGGIGERHEDLNSNGTIDAGEPLIGICTGKTTYMWNVYNNGVAETNTTYDGSTELISFIKIDDSNGVYCTDTTRNPPKAQSSVLVDDGLAISEPTTIQRGSNNQLLRFTFTISTANQSAGGDFDISGGACQGGKDNEFCALNTFVVTSYAKGI